MKLKSLLASLALLSAGSILAQNVGISTSSPKSKLDVNGGLSVGSYAGVNAAPANGAIISGNVGIGYSSPSYKLDVNGEINAATGFKVAGGTPSTSTYLKGDGTNFVAGTIQAADIPILNQNTTGSAGSFTGSLAGDVSGIQSATMVDKIKGAVLGSTTATSGNLLIGSGTQWVSNPLSGDATINSSGVVTLTTLSNNYIKNQSNVDQTADFRINGKGLLTSVGSQLAIGTATPSSANGGYQMTMTPNSTNSSGINISMSGAVSTSYGLNITASSQNANGILITHNSASTSNTLYGTGSVLSSSNIVSGYTGYRNSSGLSYGLYGINGTNASYASSANTWALFAQGRAVISSESSPTSPVGTDLEVRNTTTGGSAPATVAMRQTTAITAAGTVMTNLNFGDNNITGAQAQIQVQREVASSGNTDLPTAMTFSTITDGTASLTERMRITNAGNVGIGTTSVPTESSLALGGFSANEGGQLQLNSATGFTQAYFLDVYQNRLRILQGTNTGSSNEMARIVTDGSTGSYSQFNGQIIGTAFAATNIETIFDGQGLSDNVYHTLTHNTGYAMTGLSVYAATYFDGNIRLSGTYLGSILGSTVTWYGNNGSSTQGVTCGNGANVSNTKGGDQDNTWHWAACPDNYLATGFEAYASGSYLDGCIKLRCTSLNSAFSTTNNTNSSINTNGGSNPNTNNTTASLSNMNGVETAFNTPWNTGYDNCYHTTFCPVGTFVRGIKMYAGSQIDGNMSVFCTGIKAN